MNNEMDRQEAGVECFYKDAYEFCVNYPRMYSFVQVFSRRRLSVAVASRRKREEVVDY